MHIRAVILVVLAILPVEGQSILLRGRVEMLRDRALQEGRERDARDAAAALGAVARADRLIADVLDATRLEHGLFAVTVAPTDLVALAREAGLRADLGGGLAGLAWLDARLGREESCRANAAEALEICAEI